MHTRKISKQLLSTEVPPWVQKLPDLQLVHCLKEGNYVASILFPSHQLLASTTDGCWAHVTLLGKYQARQPEEEGVAWWPRSTMSCTISVWLGTYISGHTVWYEKLCMQGKIHPLQADPFACVVAAWLIHGYKDPLDRPYGTISWAGSSLFCCAFFSISMLPNKMQNDSLRINVSK